MSDSFKKYKNKHVLVTGATGFTGQHVTKKLVAAGAKVRAIVRPTSNLGPFKVLKP